MQLTGHIGDPPEKLELKLFADADFAGCKATRRSTSGVYLCLSGENTHYPLAAISKKQTCVSHSTPEAELVAMDAALRTEGLPALDLWETILGRTVKLNFEEDNQAALQIVQSGKNPNIRHMGRTHGVCAAWLHERLTEAPDKVKGRYCDTAEMAADLMTKGFTDPAKWSHAIGLVGLKTTAVALREG